MNRLAENLAHVKRRIASAALRSGRPPGAVKLVAVTKSAPVNVVHDLIALGIYDLGESRPQVLWNKAAALADQAVCWHLIGHLQRNKVQRTLPLVSMIHAGDSMRLLQAIDAAAAVDGRRVPLLLEINISGDASKHGFTAAEVERQLPAIARLTHVEIRGLMGMASREGDLEQARQEFSRLRQLRDRLQSSAPPEIALEELSMGMSGDFDVAIEAGATIVRIGSALFEGLNPEP
ncbi:MAG: YggS family pyridoxal phosphate-dependent enzyme [Pirellulales bacterium]|nr:YggS family pyridoxal phosphate-dependent enzyme [Pirellulales bacterium]